MDGLYNFAVSWVVKKKGGGGSLICWVLLLHFSNFSALRIDVYLHFLGLVPGEYRYGVSLHQTDT